MTDKTCGNCKNKTELNNGTWACDVDGYPVDCTPPNDVACPDWKLNLKPCPFCGGEAKLEKFRAKNLDGVSFYVHCPHNENYECPMNVTTLEFHSPDSAIEAWNRRAE